MFKKFLFFGIVFILTSYGEVLASDVEINEIAWMGSENSASDEWIELYNPGESSVNLDGWVLSSTDGSPSVELVGLIGAYSYFLLERTDDESAVGVEADMFYSGSLSNTGENFELLDTVGNLIDALDCSGGWLSGDNENKYTMQKSGNTWVSSCAIGGTPKVENVFCDIDENDAEQSTTTPSTSSNSKQGSSQNNQVSSEQASTRESDNSTIANTNEVEKSHGSDIVISEIMPNPIGVDSNEWIELYNKGKKRVDISGWILRDRQSEYVFIDTHIHPGEYFLLLRSETNIALNNKRDELQLLDDVGTKNGLAVRYLDAPAGISLALSMNETGDKLLWTTTATPEKENVITTPNQEPFIDFEIPELVDTGDYFICDASDSMDPDEDSLSYRWYVGDDFVATGVLLSYIFSKPGKYSIGLEISDGEYSVEMVKRIEVESTREVLDSYKDGEAQIIVSSDVAKTEKKEVVKINTKERENIPLPSGKIYNIPSKKTLTSKKESITGIVTSLPGTLASQYFYITGSSQSYQVYSYNKDFKELNIGDEIKVIGERSIVNDEVRIKTKTKNDINILSRENETEAMAIKSNLFSEELLGYLVDVEGEVTRKNGLNVYIDDGIGEMKIYFKKTSGTNSSLVSTGDYLKVVGILSKTGTGYRILPRNKEDLIIPNQDDEKGVVLGETSSSTGWKLDEREKKYRVNKYYAVFLLSIFLASMVLVYRKTKK